MPHAAPPPPRKKPEPVASAQTLSGVPEPPTFSSSPATPLGSSFCSCYKVQHPQAWTSPTPAPSPPSTAFNFRHPTSPELPAKLTPLFRIGAPAPPRGEAHPWSGSGAGCRLSRLVTTPQSASERRMHKGRRRRLRAGGHDAALVAAAGVRHNPAVSRGHDKPPCWRRWPFPNRRARPQSCAAQPKHLHRSHTELHRRVSISVTFLGPGPSAKQEVKP